MRKKEFIEGRTYEFEPHQHLMKNATMIMRRDQGEIRFRNLDEVIGDESIGLDSHSIFFFFKKIRGVKIL